MCLLWKSWQQTTSSCRLAAKNLETQDKAFK
jgi:hypothetical protein